MSEEPAANSPGALRSALFLDVPYILDSLWRWGEFRVNRLGSVNFDDPHDYVLRPAWQSGAFALFSLMCLFAIFGPTSDALCALRGSQFAGYIRVGVSALLIVGALLLFLRVLNAVTFYLMRRAETLATASASRPRPYWRARSKYDSARDV